MGATVPLFRLYEADRNLKYIERLIALSKADLESLGEEEGAAYLDTAADSVLEARKELAKEKV